jgi:hypothetical protein
VQAFGEHRDILATNICSVISVSGEAPDGKPSAPYIPPLKQVGFTGHSINPAIYGSCRCALRRLALEFLPDFLYDNYVNTVKKAAVNQELYLVACSCFQNIINITAGSNPWRASSETGLYGRFFVSLKETRADNK